MSLLARGRTFAGVLVALLLAAGIGWGAPGRPALALVVAFAVLVLGVSALQTATIPLLTLPLLFVAQRAAFGGADLSISDLALGIGTLAAAVFARRPFAPELRNLLWLVVIYQVATLFTVVANPYAANVVEWVHAGVLVAGGLLVGWVVGREGYAALGIKLMVLVALVLATWVIFAGVVQVLTGNFEPVYLPFRMHKNFLGTVMAIMALTLYVRPEWTRMRPGPALLAFSWLVIGIGFTQSRQAIVALGIALVVLVLRTRSDRRRSQLIILGVVPALAIVLTLVRDQAASDNQHNSYFSRLDWYQQSIDIWQSHPILGVGLRWWYTDRFQGGIQPPNAELEMLTSAGLVGLVGFLVLMVGALRVLWRMPPAYGMLAFLVLLSRLIQGQLDIFWVAAQTSIPFVIVGICLGVRGRDEDGTHTQDELSATLPDVGPRVGVSGAAPR